MSEKSNAFFPPENKVLIKRKSLTFNCFLFPNILRLKKKVRFLAHENKEAGVSVSESYG